MADALVHGKGLRIEGGPVQMEGRRCCRIHDDEGKEEDGGGIGAWRLTPFRKEGPVTEDNCLKKLPEGM
jgi:hypothetical protein